MEQGNTEKDDEYRTMNVIFALDGARYEEFLAEILNDVAKGAIFKQKKINDVFNLAISRVVVSKNVTSRNT